MTEKRGAKDYRFILGVIVSLCWIGFMVFMFIEGERPTQLNAWGDFFGGFFAPLAFLWLVLGYLQQGEELRLSSSALQMQAEELRNSVEQQSNLVEVSRAQLQQELETSRYQREEQLRASKPLLVVGLTGLNRLPTQNLQVRAAITNLGEVATNIFVKLVDSSAPVLLRSAPRGNTLARDATLELIFELPHGRVCDGTFRFTFVDRLGASQSTTLRFRLAEDMTMDIQFDSVAG